MGRRGREWGEEGDRVGRGGGQSGERRGREWGEEGEEVGKEMRTYNIYSFPRPTQINEQGIQ